MILKTLVHKLNQLKISEQVKPTLRLLSDLTQSKDFLMKIFRA